jgi:AcrR family transcriptional regulator
LTEHPFSLYLERVFSTPPASSAARIVEAAIDLFGRHGVASTSVRAIAEQAGVSAALVIHHFGSKEGLRTACDERVMEFIRSSKSDSIRAESTLMPAELQGLLRRSRPAMRYLARTLGDGSPRINELMDDMVTTSMAVTAEAEAAGLVRPSTDDRARTIVLTLWMFGPLVLHEHLQRLLGVDLLDEDSDTLPYIRAALELLTEGFLTDSAYKNVRMPSATTEHAHDNAEGTS